MKPAEEHADDITRALNYPYSRPKGSFTISGKQVHDLPPDFWPLGRIPVLACGSNAAPEQLVRKFGSHETDAIHVTQAHLKDYLIGYSAHIAGYGAIPATLAVAKGHGTDCHITWLTEAQLRHMHKTEAVGKNYRFSELSNLSLQCSQNGLLTTAFAYISLRGYLAQNDNPILIKDLNTAKAPFQEMSQQNIQRLMCSLVSPASSVEDFIVENITDPDLRRDRVHKFGQYAKIFSCPNEKIILPQEA
ncbi:hypothetical protein [Sneathiella sp.]|jgi:hypothetical protein|uniref:hypothetical protein n=1 Tax=Sneathiella sp. TaxID=1964365 RepID=UPI0039E25968